MNEILVDTRDLAEVWDLYGNLIQENSPTMALLDWQKSRANSTGTIF